VHERKVSRDILSPPPPDDVPPAFFFARRENAAFAPTRAACRGSLAKARRLRSSSRELRKRDRRCAPSFPAKRVDGAAESARGCNRVYIVVIVISELHRGQAAARFESAVSAAREPSPRLSRINSTKARRRGGGGEGERRTGREAREAAERTAPSVDARDLRHKNKSEEKNIR